MANDEKPKGGGPWGGNQGPWGRGGPSGGPPNPQIPSIEHIIGRVQDFVRQMFSGGSGGARLGLIVLAALVLLWGFTGIYRVEPDEQGVVLRFGKYVETTQSGLHYHLPAPIETVFTPKVTFVNRTDIGASAEPGRGDTIERPEESLMLTGDENIVDINLSVFWFVTDARAYLFNIRNPDQTVKSAAESAVREIVGRTQIASVLAEGRHQVEIDTQELLQSVLDSYGSGIKIQQVQLQKVDPPNEVIEAFRDVQRARTDEESLRNKAEAYHNDIVPRARGQAQQIIQDAEAYKQQVVAKAGGDAARFDSVLNAYRSAKDVTAERLYLDMMDQVLKGANKVVIDKSAASVVPYLPVPQLASPPSPPVTK
jgi:membrane protease subunit HflK